MFILVFALAAVIVVAARLVADLRQDRPLWTPRSHAHEIDPQRLRLARLF